MMKPKRTLVGNIDAAVLAFTAGQDAVLDRELVEADCIGTAAHVTMLAAMRLERPVIAEAECAAVKQALLDIMRGARAGRFRIRTADQDVHMAIERTLTARLGDVGKRVHTGRSRNDQVAVDLRLYGKDNVLQLLLDLSALASALLRFARAHAQWPMVGRTHLQPAMPSSVGLWASAYAEGLLDDGDLLRGALEHLDRCPLGSAAGYGVPLPIDRERTARLLGFAGPVHNVLHASQTRGKVEGIVLAALSRLMLTLSRLSADLILYTMPEFGYFSLPAELCTGSSIMPQKKNPDVLELVRGRAARVRGYAAAVDNLMHALPGGYHRDLQETKEPFIEGLRTTRACVAVMTRLIGALKADRAALGRGFRPGVFAADRALELVRDGVPFRDAYDRVRAGLANLEQADPGAAIAAKGHLGGTGALGLPVLGKRVRALKEFASRKRSRYHAAVSRLLDTTYPELS